MPERVDRASARGLRGRLAPLALSLLLTQASAAGPETPPDPWDLASAGRALAVLANVMPTPKMAADLPADRAYLVGVSLVRVHRPVEARTYLESARAREYGPPPGWEPIADLLKRITEFESLRPPLRLAYPATSGDPIVRLYAHAGPWGSEVAADVPFLVAAAGRIFPDAVPPTDIYLLEERKAFERFFVHLFGMESVRWWQHGTGRVHAVVFCSKDRAGLPHAPAALARLPADLLHEYGHALCEARFGDRYLEQVPQWLNEGLADFIARGRYPESYLTCAEVARTAHEKATPPTYAEMTSQLYDRDPTERYAFALLMVEQLLGSRAEDAIAPLLDEARRLQDFEKAMVNVCKMSGAEARAAALRSLDSARKPAKDKPASGR